MLSLPCEGADYCERRGRKSACHDTSRLTPDPLLLHRSAYELVPTHNHTGYISRYLDPVSDQFVKFSGAQKKPCLEIGAGFGAASLAAVRAGAPRACVTDPDESHLGAYIPKQKEAPKIELRVGSVPYDLSNPSCTFGSILAARVLHFLPGPLIEVAVRDFADWLKPGGRLFITCDSIHAQQFAPLLNAYQKRKKQGDVYPGYFAQMGRIHKKRKKDLPNTFHFFECNTLARVLGQSGLKIVSLGFFGRPDYPLEKKKDGRECVGLVAEKV